MHLKTRHISKTRKVHICSDCGRRIDVGESCREDCCVDMGVHSFYTCDVCIAFLKDLKETDKSAYDSVYFFGDELTLCDVEGYAEFAANFAVEKMLRREDG
jgi:hypothetical protein